MIGLGTIINTAAIIVGGLLGLLFGKKLTKRFQDTLMTGIGICVVFLGIAGTLSKMLLVTDTGIETQGTMMLIICVALGAVTGELFNIDGALDRVGDFLKRKTGNEKDAGFVDGFVTATLTVCIGAMAVIGSIQDGISKDPTTLIAKALLDLIIIMVMTGAMGKGCIFSALPVLIIQGNITLLARVLQPIMTEAALTNLSMVGSALIFCVGLNLIRDKKIKVANMFPAIFFAVAYAFLPWN